MDSVSTLTTRTVLRYTFEVLKLHQVDLRVFSFNERGVKCYLQCGFVVEGRKRESCRLDDQWHDDLIMGITEGDYQDATRIWS